MVFLMIPVLFSMMMFSLQSNAVFAYPAALSESINLFAGDLLSVILDQKPTENVVYSPISVYTILALTYMGTGGSTSDELQTILKLNPKLGKTDFASKYGDLLKGIPKNILNEEYEVSKPPQLSIANAIYISKYVKILEQFHETARENFKAKVENVDFSDNLAAAIKINNWVEERTSNKVKNLINPNAVNMATRMVLVNAIYLKAKWRSLFSPTSTKPRHFHLNRNKAKLVNTMNTMAPYFYAPLPELDAIAVELPLRNSDISMLIILPNEIDGLKQVEEKLKGKDLNYIVRNLKQEILDLYLPKFRIEFNIDLKESLEKMGCSAMFRPNANFTEMFVDGSSNEVSAVNHKAYLECGEDGLEAAGASAMEIFDRGGLPRYIAVDHPFFFAIRSTEAVFFAGHVVNI